MEKWSVIKHYRDIVDSENGVIVKTGKIKVALIYPNTYPIASQNLGFQYVYSILNTFEDIVCERFVLDFYEDNLSIETQRFLSEFDFIVISINYEEDILNLIKFLESQKINAFASKRDTTVAPIIAGGALTVINPRLLYSIVDIQLCGDFEPMIDDFKKSLENYESKDIFLQEMTSKYYAVSKNKSEISELAIKSSENPVYSTIKSSQGDFANEFLIELSVGCKYSCRFCTATYAYRPYRVIEKENVIKAIKDNKFGKKVGLISAAFGDLKHLSAYMQFFHDEDYKISVSSLRIDTLTTEKLENLKQLSIRSITIAEETCSDRMKKLIGKEITEQQILPIISKVAEVGIENLKLYYMIGLPFEEIEDIEAIIARIETISEIFRRVQKEEWNRLGRIKVSINIFVPKPLTPMQYFTFTDKKSIDVKIKLLNKYLRRIPNLKFDIMSYKEGSKQAFLSKAEDYIDDFYMLYIENNFNIKKAVKDFKIEQYLSKEFTPDYTFAWEKLLNSSTRKNILIKEFKRCLEIKTD